MSQAKPFSISKKVVWEAYERVKANKGAAGVDEQSIADFEENLKDNLYKIWNRMSSGCYFPPAVRTVGIPKKDGSERKLGIPTVSDRIAQMVVKLYMEPSIEPIFHEDSYGYRPKKSALQAVEVARARCLENSWVVDLDIKGFFDNIDHELMMKAVRKCTSERWILILIERWLKAPSQDKNGVLLMRDKGTPQGGVISPLLANLFLHFAFDKWMSENHSDVKFERYADDIVIHCIRLKDAHRVLNAIKKRLNQCKLEAHPEKTKIVLCQDDRRNLGWGYQTKFDFLGFTFQKRTARDKEGNLFNGFLPAISMDARRKISRTIGSWHIYRQPEKSLEELSRQYNPQLRGWFNYYGRFYKHAMSPIHQQIQFALVQWSRRKHKSLRSKTQAGRRLYKIARSNPSLFGNWQCFYGGSHE